MPTLSTVLFSTSLFAINIRLLYGYANQNRPFYGYANEQIPSLVMNLELGMDSELDDIIKKTKLAKV